MANETTTTETETETTSNDTRQTGNHDWTLPSPGYSAGLDPSWPQLIIDAFDAIDSTVEVRDVDGAKGDYQPKQGAKYLATDTGSRYIGDGETWNPLPAPGDAAGLSNPLTGNLDADGHDVQNVGTLDAESIQNTKDHATTDVSHTRYVGPDDPAQIEEFNVQDGDQWIKLEDMNAD